MRLSPLIEQTQNPEIQALLHPSAAFAHPRDVVNDLDLTIHEKRAILSSWASDACAVESCPPLRRPPGGRSVTFDEVMDALRSLDDDPAPRPGGKGIRLRSGPRAGSGPRWKPGALGQNSTAIVDVVQHYERGQAQLK